MGTEKKVSANNGDDNDCHTWCKKTENFKDMLLS